MKKHLKRQLAAWLLVFSVAAGLIGCGKKEETAQETAVTQEATAAQTETAEGTESGTGDAAAEKQKAADFSISIDSNNSWENNGMHAAQFDAVIENNTSTAGKDWKVVITVPEGSKLENGWNGNYDLKGTSLTVTPVDYNTEVALKGNVTFGFILDTKESFSISSAVLTINGKDYAMGETAADTVSDDEKAEEDEKADGEEQTEKVAEAAKDAPGDSAVAKHGALSVKGTDILDKDGKVYQLKGVSTHGIGWFPDYVNKDAFSDFQKCGANAMRLAMYSDEGAGYCTGGNKEQLEGLIDKGVKACTELGMYVIIDWHVLGEGDPTVHKDEAKKFFEKISKKYASYDNVLYEICNEPNGGVQWDTVKMYAEEVIPVIRANDKKAIIIVGTPTWSQDVDIASENPITGFDNIVYAVHFYAATHTDNIRSKVKTARKNGLPLIVSECSICDASGNGNIDYGQAEEWFQLINEYHLGYFAWNLSNKDETSSLVKSSVSKTSGFTKEDLSETGQWFSEQFGK